MIFKPQLLFQYGHEYVHRDGNPYLRLHRIRGQAIERFDSEMLFYPFEKQFYLPAELVQLGYNQSWKCEIVCKKGKTFFLFLVVKNYTSQFFRIVFSGFLSGEHDSLIASESSGFVHRSRIQTSHRGVAFGSGEEKSQRKIDSVKSSEVQISPVDKVKCARLQNEFVQDVYIVNRAVRNAYENWDRAPDVEECMHLHSSLGFSEASPREKAQTKVYGCRVERINSIVEIQAEVLVHIKFSCFHDEQMGELRIYSPVSALVGICKRAFPHRTSYSHVVEFSTHCIEADIDVPQALPVRQLSKRHAIKLVEATEASYSSVAIVFLDAFLKLILGEKFHDLRKNRFAVVH